MDAVRSQNLREWNVCTRICWVLPPIRLSHAHLYVFCAILSGFPAISCGEPIHENARWLLENGTIRVSVDESNGAWDVVDKRCGRHWRQPDLSTGVIVKQIAPMPAPADEIVHTGDYAARLSGTQESGYSYASSIKIPIKPNKQYTLRGWLRVDSLEPADSAPGFKCGIYQDKKWLTNFFTPQYNLSKLGTWQELTCTFTVPEKATAGLIALEKRTTEAMTATLYIDDVELIPTATTRDGEPNAD